MNLDDAVELEDEVVRHLNKLGSDPEVIRQSLKDLDIVDAVSTIDDCPLAQYLNKAMSEYTFEVMPNFGVIGDDFTILYVDCSIVAYQNDEARIHLDAPAVFSEFACKFDEGKYPELRHNV